MSKQKLFFLLLSLLLLATPCYLLAADTTTAPSHPHSTTMANTKIMACPTPNALKKNPDPNKLNWTADHGQFKSYAKSFVTTIKHFLGAQWQGANVGQITCLYAGESSDHFPIQLVYHTLALEPCQTSTSNKTDNADDAGDTGNNHPAWTKNQGGYCNCKSDHVTSCQFLVQLEPKQKDLINQLKFKG